MTRPNFFIVGAPKCGTTSMVEYLHVHPEVYVPREKDLYYFGEDLEMHRPDQAAYLEHFKGAGRAKWIGESSVQYLRSESAPGEIAAWCDDPRVLIMLRNPVDFLYSYQGQLVYHMEEDILDFEEAIRAQDDRRDGKRLPRDSRAPSKLQYFRIASFAEHVERWYETLGRERVRVVLMDDMKADTPDVYRSVLEWLEVNTGFAPEFVRHNTKRWLTAPHVLRALKKTPRLRKFIFSAVPQSTRRKAGATISKVMRTPERQPMSAEFRAELLEHFRPGIDHLGELLDRDLSGWYSGT